MRWVSLKSRSAVAFSVFFMHSSIYITKCFAFPSFFFCVIYQIDLRFNLEEDSDSSNKYFASMKA